MANPHWLKMTPTQTMEGFIDRAQQLWSFPQKGDLSDLFRKSEMWGKKECGTYAKQS